MVLLEPLELPRGFILWVCDSNFFGELITPPPVPAKLAWLLPGWPSKHGCRGWVPALESQLAEGLLAWLASSPELLAQAGVALLSWGSWLHGAALRFTNKQEARPLPPCWGWSPVLITQLARGEGAAQDSQGSCQAEVVGNSCPNPRWASQPCVPTCPAGTALLRIKVDSSLSLSRNLFW